MKSIELLALLIKLTSILLVFGMMRSAVSVVSYLSGGYGFDPQLLFFDFVNLGVIFIGFTLALIFWNFPIAVAKWFVPKSNDQNYPKINLEIESLEIVLYSAIGVYLVAQYVPDLAYDILYYSITVSADSDFALPGRTTLESVLKILYSVSSIVIGVFLAFYCGNLKRVLKRIRGNT